MPADASIYGLQQPPKLNTPFDVLPQMLAIKNQQQAGQALAEQRRASADKARQEADQARQDAAAAAQVRALFSRDVAPTIEELSGVIGPEKSADIFKGFEALRTARSTNAIKDTERIAQVLGGVEAFPMDLRGSAYAGALQLLTADGTLKPGQAPPEYDPNFVKAKRREALSVLEQFKQDAPPADYTLGDARMSGATNQPIATAAPKPDALGSDADFIKRFADARRLDPAKLSPAMVAAALRQKADATRAPQQPQQDNSPLETIIGPDGTPIRVRRQDAIGKAPATGTMKPASGLEKRALNFFNRAQQADGELETLEAEIQKMGLGSQVRLSKAPNWAQSQLGQSYGAAQRAFTEARLRKDSGAAIPEGEFVNDRQTYFAQPGDSKETLEQKRRARGAILASLAFESGQALGEFIGDADEAKSIVQKYKARSAGTTAAPTGKVTITSIREIK